MIELAFRADESAFAEDLDASPEDASAAAVEQTYFVVATRLAIDGIELLEYPGVHAAWRPLPLLGFASSLRRVVSTIADGQAGSISLADGGVLCVERRGETLRLSSSLVPDNAASVQRDVLMQESEKFGTAACLFVSGIVPAMRQHPAWRSWCPESA
jgi:hypothetical protein